jgi:GTP 3',8-cyclase
MPLLDQLQRPLRTLRISVTDRCNLRCEYCMPEEEYAWLPRDDVLDVGELERLARLFVQAGVEKIRLTGGEPLLRADLVELVRRLARIDGLKDLALTTNGVLLAENAVKLRDAGLHRMTVSLDTLQPDRFKAMSRRELHSKVLGGIEAASESGLPNLKLDAVIVRGVNDEELIDLLEYGKRMRAEVRFIEYMDVAGATHWSMDRVVSRAAMLDRVAAHYGPISNGAKEQGAPADRYLLPDGAAFGIIASTTAPFCRECDRSRLSADGLWFRCLYAIEGIDLRTHLRAGASDAKLSSVIETGWLSRTDRGAELRRGVPYRQAFVPVETLRKHPHLEMHTRGG